jgi:PAS domain S-box-containing protein
MGDMDRARAELISEVARLRDRIADLEAAAARQHAEQAPLRAALDATVNAIVLTNRSGTIEWVNPAFTRLTGYSAAEAVGKNPRDLVKSGHHEPAFYRNLWETILAGRIWQGETTNRRKDGSLYTEEQAITPVRDAQGEIAHFIAVKHDVTERKRAEAELRARAQVAATSAAIGLALNRAETLRGAMQQCAEALVAHLDVALARIWTLDQRVGVLELQASAGLYTHVDGGHATVRLGELKIGRIARDRQPHMTNAVAGDPEIDDQEWARREGMIAFAGHPLILDERVLGVVAVFARRPLSDAVMAAMTSLADHVALGIERLRTTQTLRTTEERMRFALENAHVGVWDIDYATGVLQWSDILELQCGLKPGTFEGTFEAFMERIHPEDRASTLATFRQAQQTGADFSEEHRTIRPDGTVRWLSGAGRILLDERGEPQRGIGISLDVTERRKLEQQFQQAQKMEAVGRLAGGVAHDFNNLLTAVLGYCELLLATFAADDPRRRDLEQVASAATRGAGLTRQLLAFSRKQIIDPKLLDVNAVMKDMRPMLTRLIGEDVRVTLELTPELAPVVADRTQIEQIAMNLAVNARDAMPRGGSLTISTSHVQLDEDYAAMHVDLKPGAYVALTMTDTGTGMTPEVQAHLFEPFFTTKEEGRGTGLGLATVYGIVKQSGGTIGVYSEVGKGTSVHVYLPRAAAAPPLREEAEATRRIGGTETILVVEDAEGLRQLLKRVLAQQGYTVLAAANANEALRLVAQTSAIDLVLTDVVMPGASGPELTKQIAEQFPAMKVVYMSGYTEDAISQHGVLKPGIAFLHKPFTSQTLGRKIRDVLDA